MAISDVNESVERRERTPQAHRLSVHEPDERFGVELYRDGQVLQVQRLEREAEETAQRVMQGGELGVYRMANADVHVQRATRGGLGSADPNETWSPAASADAAGAQSSDSELPDADATDYSVSAEPEALAAEVESIKGRQAHVMQTLTEATPGGPQSPDSRDLAKTATKGATGALTGAAAGAAVGSAVGGPVGTLVGAGVGVINGMTSDVAKQGVEYTADRLPGSKAQEMEQLYSRMTELYTELVKGSDHGGNDEYNYQGE